MILPSSTGTVTGSRAGELKDPLCSKQQNSPASGQIIKNCHVGTKGPITTAMKQAVASIGRLSFCPFFSKFSPLYDLAWFQRQVQSRIFLN